MNQDTTYSLSKNNLRRMQAWARLTFPNDGLQRATVVVEYLAQMDNDAATDLVKKDWPAVFAQAERDWPEAFAEFQTEEQ